MRVVFEPAQDIRNADDELVEAKTDEALKIASENFGRLNELKTLAGG